jgi:hypothetical protein
MKKWQVTLGVALIIFIVALIMFFWANSLEHPTVILEYSIISNQYFLTFLAGVLFTGIGSGFLICTILIYQLEKKLDFKSLETGAINKDKD